MINGDSSVRHPAVSLSGVGVILVASFLFGTMAVAVRLAAREMPSIQIAFFRFAGSLLLMMMFTRARRLRPQPGNGRRLLIRGLLGASAIAFYYSGIEAAGAGLATLLQCTYPISTALFAVTLLGEPFSARLGIALTMSLAGVVIVLGPASDLGPQVVQGGLSSLTASVLAGGAVATARHLRATESASLITTCFMGVGAVVTAPSLLLGLPPLSIPLLCALAVVVLTSVAGQWLLHQGLGFASATQGSLAAATSVVTAAGLETVFLGERPSSHTLLGACIMIAAIGLAVSRRQTLVTGQGMSAELTRPGE